MENNKVTLSWCHLCDFQKPIDDGEWNESIFICNDCIYDPDYYMGEKIKIKGAPKYFIKKL